MGEDSTNSQTKAIDIIDIDSLRAGGVTNQRMKDSVVKGQSEAPDVILGVVNDYGTQHFVQQNNPSCSSAIETSKIMLYDRKKFFDKPLVSIFEPEKIDSAAEEQFLGFEFAFSKASEKTEMINKLSEYLNTFCKRQGFMHDVLLVADELFTNAVFNAPFVTSEANQKSGAPRNQADTAMTPGKTGRLFAGKDHEFLVLGCHDPYGTLSINGLIERIHSCYKQGASQVMNKDSAGGAGIGSYLIFNISNNFYALVENQTQTLICCAFAYSARNVDRSNMPKNVHLYGLDPTG